VTGLMSGLVVIGELIGVEVDVGTTDGSDVEGDGSDSSV